MVVSPDLGNAKEAAAFARLLGTPVAAGAKQRFSDDLVKISTVIGDVADRDVIVLDDEIAKGSTVIELMGTCASVKVRSIRLACTHGLFSGGALERLSAQDGVLEIVCTNTVPIPAGEAGAEAAGAVGGPGAGRGDAADPQRRVGQRPLRLIAPAAGAGQSARSAADALGGGEDGALIRTAVPAGPVTTSHRVAELAGQPEAPAAGGVRGRPAAVVEPLRADPAAVVGDLADQLGRPRRQSRSQPWPPPCRTALVISSLTASTKSSSR